MANFRGAPDFRVDAARLIGRKIVDVRWQTDGEIEERMWSYRAPVIVLDNGETISGMCDDEGNNAGPLELSKGAILPVSR